MKSKATLTLFASLLLMAATYAPIQFTQAATTGGPKLMIESLEHTFGKIPPGTPLTYTFKGRNTGDADLKIKNVTPSCGCTAENFNKLVTAGKEGGIPHKTKNTPGYQGKIVKTATVT